MMNSEKTFQVLDWGFSICHHKNRDKKPSFNMCMQFAVIVMTVLCNGTDKKRDEMTDPPAICGKLVHQIDRNVEAPLTLTASQGEEDDLYGHQRGSIVDYHQKMQTLYSQMIRVRITSGTTVVSFSMKPDSTTEELYRTAEFYGITEYPKDTVLWKHSGCIIPDDESMSLITILAPLSPENAQLQRHLILSVFAVEQIEITVHITNGDESQSFVVNAATRVSAVYQIAMDIGILKNRHRFWLMHRFDRNRVLDNDVNDSTPPRILLHSINLRYPNELRLIVSPIPEGYLLFALFHKMTPNQHVPFWKYAEFCERNPWHCHCSDLSWALRKEDAASSNAISGDTISGNKVFDWPRNIAVVNEPTWSGALHLECMPRCVRLLTLKGRTVAVNFKTLRFSSLTYLSLDFEEVIGFDVAALSGSSLKVLKLESHPGIWELQKEGMQDVLNGLMKMREQRKIRLKKIVFGTGMVYYDSLERRYVYVDTPATDSFLAKRMSQHVDSRSLFEPK